MMGRMRTLMIIVVGFVLGGCVELTGQRIAWSHDQASDTLSALVFYDGIHNNPTDDRGAQQVAEFIANDSVMLIDWYMHYQLRKLRGMTEAPDAETRALAGALKHVTVEPLGHYREPNGRIGAAQLVTIRNAQAVLTQINAAICRAIVRDMNREDDAAPPADPAWARTRKLIRTAAEGNNSWLSLDGHALRLTVPIDNREWAKQKADLLGALFAVDDGARDDERRRMIVMLRQLLAGSAVSYAERAGAVDITIGRTDEPTLIRLHIRDRYEANLDDAVKRHVPAGLGERIVADEAVGVVSFGPPEARVLAFMGLAARDDETSRAAGLRGLRSFALRWNAAGHLPAAPVRHHDLDEWRTWYEAMKAWPIALPVDDDDVFDE